MSLPLLWISLAFLAGVIVASFLHLHFLGWLMLGFLASVGMGLAYRYLPAALHVRIRSTSLAVQRRGGLLAVTALLFFFIGGTRYQLGVQTEDSSQISWYNDLPHDVLVSGTLTEPPDVRDRYANLRLQVNQVDTGSGSLPARGLVLARVGPNEDFDYGQNLRLRGRLETPPSNEDFSYQDYLSKQGIRSYMPVAEATVLPGRGGNPLFRAVFALKEVSLLNLYRLFVDPEASLLAGILLGVDTGMPVRLEQAFNDTGTSHIIAISGFNIAVIAGVFAFAFNRLLGPRRGALAAFAGIVFYAVFVGSDPAVVRAAIMGVVTLLAVQVGRRQTGINTLAFVAALMAAFNPLILWDVGFQLSLFATAGLIIYGGSFMQAARDWIQRRISTPDAQRIATGLGEFVFLTFAAQLTTLPLMAYHFKQISLVSPLANALILPAQPAVMVLGGLALLCSLVVYPLGQLLAWAAWPLTAYTIRIVEFLAALPQAVIYLGSLSLGLVVAFYVLLLVLTVAGPRLPALIRSVRERFPSFSLGALNAALFVFALLAWRLVAAAPDGRLHVTFLDVGSADAVHIQAPSGRHVLINGGPSAAAVSDSLGRRLSPLDHRLDWLVVAAADESQVAALPRVVKRFPPENVLLGAPEQASFSSGALMEWFLLEQVPFTRAQAGQTLDLGDGVVLKVLDVSSRGTTLLLEWKSFRLLLPIGANLDTLAALESGQAVGPVHVLLLAQSGYGPLTPVEWLHKTRPQLVIISVGAADRDGRPDAETLDVLEDYPVLRTDENGWIEVSTDGTQMWVSSEREPREAQP